MIQQNVGPLYRQLDPEEVVGWEFGDEYFSWRRAREEHTNCWIPITYSIDEKSQVGLVTAFRRPLKPSFKTRFKVTMKGFWRGFLNGLSRQGKDT